MGIRQIRFDIRMRILRNIFQSIISIPQALKDTTVSLVHGVAVFVFVSTHYLLLRGEKAREIGDISNLIEWLEKKDPNEEVQKKIQDTLSYFLHHHVYQEPPKESCLLTALKTHRYSLKALWRGVTQNGPLLHQMWAYLKNHNNLLPLNSPIKKELQRSLLSEPPPKLDFNSHT